MTTYHDNRQTPYPFGDDDRPSSGGMWALGIIVVAIVAMIAFFNVGRNTIQTAMNMLAHQQQLNAPPTKFLPPVNPQENTPMQGPNAPAQPAH